MTTVCVPTAAVGEALVDLDLDVLVWDWLGEPPAGAERAEIVVPPYGGSPVDPNRLADLPAARVVQLLSAGYEPWPPVLPPGVTLCNGRGVHGASTAELALGGLIAVLRDLPRYAEQQRQGTWAPHQGDGLDGRRVLILGAGDIGERVAAAVTALGATATLVGRTARGPVRGIDEVPALLPEQDVVVVALPHSPETHHLVDAAFLAALPDGAAVVNVGRGPIVDTDALLAELRAKRLRAFLDVVDPEPLPAGHPLWQAPNLVLTPHVGGGTSGWQQRANALLRAQVQRYLAAEPLANVVRTG